jgi:hypothetical protein
MNKYPWACALPRHLLVWIIVLGFGTAILPGETTYQGLTPGQSRRAHVEAALRTPVRQIDGHTWEHAALEGTGPIHVQYEPESDRLTRIQVFFLQPILRSVLVERLLRNLPAETRKLDSSGALVEYFGEPAFVSLTYDSGEEARGATSISYYSRSLYDIMSGRAPVTAVAPAPPSPAAEVPLEIAQDIELRVRLLTPVSTQSSKQGDRIAAEVLSPAAYEGNLIEGVVTEVKRGAKVGGASELALLFAMLHHRQQIIPVRAELKSVVNSRGVKDADEEGRIVKHSSGLAAALLAGGAGAAIGAVAGGEKGAAIGAGTAAAASLAIIQLASNGPNVSLATGSELVLRVRGSEQESGGAQPSQQLAGAPAGGTAAQGRTPINININVGLPGSGGSATGTTSGASPQSGTLPPARLPQSGAGPTGGTYSGSTDPAPSTSSVNLALGHSASQSSYYFQPPRLEESKGAVDGKKDGGYGFHTQSEPNPWWQVDLGSANPVTEIRIFNRLDCCSERARTIQVLLSNNGNNWTRVFANNGVVFGGKDGKPLIVPVSGYSARFVRLQLAETNYLHLDEVEVYGTGGGAVIGGLPGRQEGGTVGGMPPEPSSTNLALNRTARQSSFYNPSNPKDPQYAVDGNRDTISNTDLENQPWWEVDLGAIYRITEARIYNRKDCCRDRLRTFKILLSNDRANWRLYYSHNGSVFGDDERPLTLQLDTQARYVRIQLNEKNYLSLAEVEIYGSNAQ